MEWTFRWVMFAVMMPIISLFGLIGNVTTICVLHHRDIQLKKYLVEVLSALACYDILFLLTNFLFITFPNWGIGNNDKVWEGTVIWHEIFNTKIIIQLPDTKLNTKSVLISSKNRYIAHLSNLGDCSSSSLEDLPGIVNLHDCCRCSEQMP